MKKRRKILINWIRNGYFKRIGSCSRDKKVVLFPDIRYQAVHFFPDLKVEVAEFFPNELGERQFCDRFCDIRNKYGKAFGGIPKY